MKQLHFICAAMLLVFSQSGWAQKIRVHRVIVANLGGVDQVQEYLAPPSALAAASGWEPGKPGSPAPITRAMAYEIVKEELKRRGIVEMREEQFAIKLQQGSLDEKEIARLPPGACRWHYEFRFGQETVIVLMDGSLAEVKTSPK